MHWPIDEWLLEALVQPGHGVYCEFELSGKILV